MKAGQISLQIKEKIENFLFEELSVGLEASLGLNVIFRDINRNIGRVLSKRTGIF